jgi:type I site-specific restriction-modification system R (restriction) subunit
MIPINYPAFEYQLRRESGKIQIFDILRRKYVVLTPEEWVRQHIVHFLIDKLAYPKALIKLEKGLSYNDLSKRSDVLVFDRNGNPFLVIECKAPHVDINEDTLRQVATYNKIWQAPYLAMSNGIVTICGKLSDVSMDIFDAFPVFEHD